MLWAIAESGKLEKTKVRRNLVGARNLEGLDKYRHRVCAALAYAREIEDFDNLVDPCHLYDCCLSPEPSKYILEKIRQEEKSKIVYPLLSDEKADATTLPPVHVTPPSPTLSLEVTTDTPPLTRTKDFSSLDFEKINTKILEDEANELEEVESSAMEKDPTANKAAEGKDVDESTTPSS
nr:hypothetical protein CFP56_14348 [Quercus suber]